MSTIDLTARQIKGRAQWFDTRPSPRRRDRRRPLSPRSWSSATAGTRGPGAPAPRANSPFVMARHSKPDDGLHLVARQRTGRPVREICAQSLLRGNCRGADRRTQQWGNGSVTSRPQVSHGYVEYTGRAANSRNRQLGSSQHQAHGIPARRSRRDASQGWPNAFAFIVRHQSATEPTLTRKKSHRIWRRMS